MTSFAAQDRHSSGGGRSARVRFLSATDDAAKCVSFKCARDQQAAINIYRRFCSFYERSWTCFSLDWGRWALNSELSQLWLIFCSQSYRRLKLDWSKCLRSQNYLKRLRWTGSIKTSDLHNNCNIALSYAAETPTEEKLAKSFCTAI